MVLINTAEASPEEKNWLPTMLICKFKLWSNFRWWN